MLPRPRRSTDAIPPVPRAVDCGISAPSRSAVQNGCMALSTTCFVYVAELIVPQPSSSAVRGFTGRGFFAVETFGFFLPSSHVSRVRAGAVRAVRTARVKRSFRARGAKNAAIDRFQRAAVWRGCKVRRCGGASARRMQYARRLQYARHVQYTRHGTCEKIFSSPRRQECGNRSLSTCRASRQAGSFPEMAGAGGGGGGRGREPLFHRTKIFCPRSPQMPPHIMIDVGNSFLKVGSRQSFLYCSPAARVT